MSNVASFIHLISFNLGLVAIILGVVLKRRSGFAWLGYYNRFLIAYNIAIVLAAFIKTILVAFMGEETYTEHLFDFYGYLVLFFGLLRLFLTWSFLGFAYSILERKMPRWIPVLLIIFAAFMTVFKTGFRFEGLMQEMMDYAGILGFHLVAATSIIASSIMVLRNREKIRGLNPNLVKPAFVTFMLFASADLLLRVATLLMEPLQIPVFIILLGIAAVATTFNLLNVLYIRKVVQLPRMEVRFSSEQLVRKLGITGREEEIIRLICQGRTNKEIAEALFISPITVRDHLSNIYRKAGVRSRTQLAGLFLERSAG